MNPPHIAFAVVLPIGGSARRLHAACKHRGRHAAAWRAAFAQVFDRLYNAVHTTAFVHFGAFYSSELGGIVTNPAFMLVHMDDHMVHRAHAVFDTVCICDGFLYMLDEHVSRFKASALAAGIALPLDDAALKRVLLDTAAASKKMNGGCMRLCLCRVTDDGDAARPNDAHRGNICVLNR